MVRSVRKGGKENIDTHQKYGGERSITCGLAYVIYIHIYGWRELHVHVILSDCDLLNPRRGWEGPPSSIICEGKGGSFSEKKKRKRRVKKNMRGQKRKKKVKTGARLIGLPR